MPTIRIADKSAALMAIRELHEHGELNRHLQPVPKDLDSEDDESEQMPLKADKKQYYQDEVLFFLYAHILDVCPSDIV